MPALTPTVTNRLVRSLYHVLAWTVYTTFIFAANYVANRSLQLLPTILFLLPFCFSFYVAVFFLNLYKKKGILWSIASFFLVFAVMATFAYLYIFWLLPQFGIYLYRTARFEDYLKSAVLGYVQYFSYALLYFYVRESFRKQQLVRKLEAESLQKALENARLDEQKLKAQQERLLMEFAFLRAQVNPHFLYNSLNALFAQAQDYSTDLANNIAKLSRIMRYSLESVDKGSDLVPVEKELEHLELLLDFHKLRFDQTKSVRYELRGTANGQQVPSLSLITIAENALKYGDLKDALSPVHITVRLEEHTVYFCCRNKKHSVELPFASHGIGLSNLRKRLDLDFAGHYDLRVLEDEFFYQVELTLKA